jgi:hypothetical protein
LTKGGYEMDETVLKIALAGLLNDVGKLIQRAELDLSAASKAMGFKSNDFHQRPIGRPIGIMHIINSTKFNT